MVLQEYTVLRKVQQQRRLTYFQHHWNDSQVPLKQHLVGIYLMRQVVELVEDLVQA